ncbi:asparagine synthetase [glutamine-hydrolyzing]-like [Gigantopelta aegis]|uniref:asparagine synthetase [glutamine-hydrolyzing]-like n=1 Tax=Gigantopelta aegis TaxID=1735272 RepID=UPI001B8885E2|nr:asparagine synthetase [glutamine-hydrolyzing]-like [Gigantopelta aegis]
MCGIWAVFGSDDDVSVQCSAVHTITHRGPDTFRIENINHFRNCCLGFHRLAIVDDIRGMQPMRLYTHPHIWLIYNGEIYNHKLLTEEFDLNTSTECDGEPIIHLYAKFGAEFTASHLDGVFSFCLLDTTNRKVILGRDSAGIRPMYRLITDKGFLAVCSEAKGLFGLSHGFTDKDADIQLFSPGHVEVYDLDHLGHAQFKERARYHKMGTEPVYKTICPPLTDNIKKNIVTCLEAAVEKRMMAERRIGCLLSGGLDSSLVTAIVVKKAKEMKLTYPIQTFAIGMEGSPDLTAAKKVAKYLGTEHHEVVFTPEEGIVAIEKVIYHLESYDITTIRASVGMYLLSEYISRKTDTVVIMSGEGSDEITQGYIYFHNAPSPSAADAESRRLLEDLYMYDVLRGDRTTAAWGLEIRVPFLDHHFTSYYLSIDEELRVPKKGIEKYLLRSAFDLGDFLPQDILWRPKEAFSDGVSPTTRSWHDIIQEHVEEKINSDDLKEASSLFPHNTPRSKEAYYYRTIFEKHFPGKSFWIPYYWMPKWSKSDDPSARTLKHYK